jgi:prepilin-type N-terminal cleavage/methylation domain-containing protein
MVCPRFFVSRGHDRAYTLIELLIVVAILGIAGALLVPQLVGRDSLAVQAAVRLLIADMSFAQSDSLAHQEYRRIAFFDNDDDGLFEGYALYRITQAELSDEYDPDVADLIIDPITNRPYIVDFTTNGRFEGVFISAVDIDGGETIVTYDSLGGTVQPTLGANDTPGVGGTIDFTFDTASYRVTIAPFTGKLTVEEL